MKVKHFIFMFLVILMLDGAILLESSSLFPLNVRNNNPVNIKYMKKNKWIGSKYQEGIFEVFKTPLWGLRAGMIVILANIRKTKSVKDFVLRFATEQGESMSDKHIRNYVEGLERALGYTHKIDIDDLEIVLETIIKFEGGRNASRYYEVYLDN